MLMTNALENGPEDSLRGLLKSISGDVALAVNYLDARVEAVDGDDVVEWLTHLRISRGLTDSTICTYCKNLARFFMWAKQEQLVVDVMTVNDLEEWQKWMFVAKKFGPSFRKQHITAVRQYFSWREVFKHKANPAKFVRGPKITKRVPKKYSTDDLHKLFSSCDLDTDIGVRDYAILILLYTTGLRSMELQQLVLDQVTLSERVGRVKVMGKGAKERELSFQGEAVNALRNWFSLRDRFECLDHAVWVSVGGKGRSSNKLTLRAIQNMLSRRAKKCKLKHSGIHMMRVTYATDLYDDNVDIEIIQELMGHEKVETTRRYIVISERRQKARMSNSRINLVTGRAKNGIPLWARKKQEEQANPPNDR